MPDLDSVTPEDRATVGHSSDAELDSAIAELTGETLEAQGEDPEPKEDDEASAAGDDAAEDEDAGDDADEDDAEEGDEEDPDEGEEGDESDESSEDDNEPVKLTRAQLNELIAEKVAEAAANTKKQVEETHSLIQTNIRQIAQIRGNLEAEKATLEEKLSDDKFHESPREALAAADRLKEVDRQIKEIDSHVNLQQHAIAAQKYVAEHVDMNKIPVRDVAECLAAYGYSEDQVQEFVKNPYIKASPDGIVWIMRAARAESYMKKLLTIAQGMKKQLKGKDKEAREKGNRMLDKIVSAGSAARRMGAGAGSSRSKRGPRAENLPRNQVALLSDDNLNKAIANLERRQ